MQSNRFKVVTLKPGGGAPDNGSYALLKPAICTCSLEPQLSMWIGKPAADTTINLLISLMKFKHSCWLSVMTQEASSDCVLLIKVGRDLQIFYTRPVSQIKSQRATVVPLHLDYLMVSQPCLSHCLWPPLPDYTALCSLSHSLWLKCPCLASYAALDSTFIGIQFAYIASPKKSPYCPMVWSIWLITHCVFVIKI